jgi:hypothetical protein
VSFADPLRGPPVVAGGVQFGEFGRVSQGSPIETHFHVDLRTSAQLGYAGDPSAVGLTLG